ncbi:hypothetical protein [Xanthomonas sp. GPE 39]|uniref:hypothetical protein n=1 Tax=Xanthomonas sp. GPE 39 TaxID=1583099 RepID=UPI00126A3F5A|nr:hypothetical protein [Xanthomonas sp. GPE 39]
MGMKILNAAMALGGMFAVFSVNATTRAECYNYYSNCLAHPVTTIEGCEINLQWCLDSAVGYVPEKMEYLNDRGIKRAMSNYDQESRQVASIDGLSLR